MLLDKIAWLIFIRAGSSRFPMKCYEPILGMNILGWLSSRSMSTGINPADVFVCTSTNPQDIRIVKQAKALKHGILLGPEEFPVRRITENWRKIEKYRYFVRICGDSPLFSFRAVINAVSTYEHMAPEAITNTRKRIFPGGFSIEIYNTRAFGKALSCDYAIPYEEHMCNILSPERALGTNTVDMCTDTSLDFFSLPRYTVDFREDIDIIENCIGTGHAEDCERRLEDVTYR